MMSPFSSSGCSIVGRRRAPKHFSPTTMSASLSWSVSECASQRKHALLIKSTSRVGGAYRVNRPLRTSSIIELPLVACLLNELSRGLLVVATKRASREHAEGNVLAREQD